MIANTQNIRDLKQWLCWRIEERDGEPTKVPYNPLTGEKASSTNPNTWASYEEAVKASEEHGYSGIGFVFTPVDDLCGIDLDKCLDPETGEMESWAQKIIEELNSYTEISPSGTGVHILVRGELPPGRNRKERFEAYDRNRYFTMTARHLEGTPKAIESRQEQLRSVVHRVLGEPETTNGHKVTDYAPYSSSPISDEEVIEKALAENGGKFDRLWHGDMSDYGNDHSAADDGFVHKLYSYTQDEEQIKRIHAMSALHRVEKSGKREDYLQRSIERARKNTTWFYEWPKTVKLADGTARAVEELQLEEIGILLSDVEPEEVEWLWPSRLALGKLALVDGDPGLGKSAMTLDLAARVSSGHDFPDGALCEPAGVVVLSAEDGLADTIRPRLDAAGADVSRVLSLATIADEHGQERLLSIPEDIPLIEKGIEQVGARFVVVDPLMAFLSGDTNSHRDQDVRKALAPLAGLAERTGACVLVVRHLNKAQGNNPLYRGGGSIGIIGAARMAFVVGKDPQDEIRRVLASTKNNLAKSPKSLMFKLQEADNGAVRVNWLGESEVSAHQLLATPREEEHADARSEAVEFLNDVLARGPVPASQVKQEAEDAGISERTLKRAKKIVRVITYRENEAGERRGAGRWMWKLPVAELVTEEVELCHPDVQGVQSIPKENGGPLERDEGSQTQESRLDRPSVQEGQGLSSRGPSVQGGQGASFTERGLLEACIHGYSDGKGCYLCDPDHPYRSRKRAAEDPTNHPLNCRCEGCG